MAPEVELLGEEALPVTPDTVAGIAAVTLAMIADVPAGRAPLRVGAVPLASLGKPAGILPAAAAVLTAWTLAVSAVLRPVPPMRVSCAVIAVVTAGTDLTFRVGASATVTEVVVRRRLLDRRRVQPVAFSGRPAGFTDVGVKPNPSKDMSLRVRTRQTKTVPPQLDRLALMVVSILAAVNS